MSRRVGQDGRTNCRTKQFRELFSRLPETIQQAALDAFEQFLLNPMHPSLRPHELKDGGRGKHQVASRSVSITNSYRAIYVVDGTVNVWYWIGSHSDYNTITGRK